MPIYSKFLLLFFSLLINYSISMEIENYSPRELCEKLNKSLLSENLSFNNDVNSTDLFLIGILPILDEVLQYADGKGYNNVIKFLQGKVKERDSNLLYAILYRNCLKEEKIKK